MLQRPAVCGAGEWMMGSSAREGGPSAVDMAGDVSQGERRLRQITDTIPAHIAYFDGDWVFRYGNRRYAEWFGTTSDAMTGRTVAEVIGPEVFAKVEASVGRALAGEEVTYEYSMTRSCGEVLYARSTLLPDFGVDGRVVGCYVHAVDITEQRRTYEALAQAQKMEAIGQLTGGLAHDFNNMLTVVMGSLNGLADALGEHPAVPTYVEPAIAAATAGAALIKRLLAFSRQHPIDPRPVEINEVVHGMSRLIRRSLPSNITISTITHEAELEALTDPCQLESALLNLALNARDAMPQGGELRIDCTLQPLDADAAASLELAPGNYVQIAVSDNGTGMDGETLARVFEPFFTTKEFGIGSGLGMAMVYGFIRQSGGGVRIRSRQAVGTTVALLLPQASVPTRCTPSRSNPDVADESRLVLLVEDDDKVREVVRKQLSALGYVVLEAESGHEAADMIENIPAIQLVLSDIVMPGGMDGRALARFVRRFRPSLPVVLMSGYAHASRPALEQPAFQVLDKPFSQQALADMLLRAFADGART